MSVTQGLSLFPPVVISLFTKLALVLMPHTVEQLSNNINEAGIVLQMR